MEKRIKMNQGTFNLLNFYKVSKFLMFGELKELSSSAKLLYTFLIDRFVLTQTKASKGNTYWIDKNKNIFVYATISNIREIMNCGKNKAIKLKKELIEYKLIEDVRVGSNKPNRIYILQYNFTNGKNDYLNNIYNAEFYILPKFLFLDNYFNLSNDSKLLYAVLLDRMKKTLSNIEKGNLSWIDSKRRPYITATLSNIRKIMNCGKNKAIKLKEELIEFGLLKQIDKKYMKANKYYIDIYGSNKVEVSKLNTMEVSKIVEVSKSNLTEVSKLNPTEVSKLNPINNKYLKQDINNNNKLKQNVNYSKLENLDADNQNINLVDQKNISNNSSETKEIKQTKQILYKETKEKVLKRSSKRDIDNIENLSKGELKRLGQSESLTNKARQITTNNFIDKLYQNIQKSIGEISTKTLDKLVENHGYKKVEMYVDNFDKFPGSIKNPVGFFINAVKKNFTIPVEKQVNYHNKPVQSTNFDQREIDLDFINELENGVLND